MKLKSTRISHINVSVSAELIEQFKAKLIKDEVCYQNGEPYVQEGVRQLIENYVHEG